jgi:hypothetical protein
VFIRIEFERLVRLVGANRTKNSQEQLIFPSGLDFDLDLMTTKGFTLWGNRRLRSGQERQQAESHAIRLSPTRGNLIRPWWPL